MSGVGSYPTEEEWCSASRSWREARRRNDIAGLQWLSGIADRAGLLVRPEGLEKCGEPPSSSE